MGMQRIGKITAGILTAVIAVQSVFLTCSAENNAGDIVQSGVSGTSSVLVDELPSFFDYIEQWEVVYPEDSIPVCETVTELSAGQSITADFTVHRAGLYAIKLSYAVVNSYGQYPVISLSINGETPYREALSLNLMRRWENTYDGDDPLTDAALPYQKELYDIQTCYLRDTVKYYGDVLYFYLCEGANTFELHMDSEKIKVYGITFENPDTVSEYKYVKETYTFPEYGGEPIYIEGEDAEYQSDASLYPTNDPSSAAVSPSSPYIKYLNVIGGSNWSSMGQYLEWKVTVPEDGLYRIGVKYRQNTNYALNSVRMITVDGKLPFSECKTVSFPYSATYKNLTVTANGVEAWFELAKGEHTIRMEVAIGELNEVLTHIEEIVTQLNAAYRKVIMITGTNPDSLRDYQLEEAIPETLELLKELRLQLENETETVKKMYGGSTSGSKIMDTMIKQLSEFSEDSAKITSSFADFKSNISSLGTWLVDAKSQPLSIDYLCLYGKDSEMRRAGASFWESFKYQLKSFLYTFSDAYKNVSDENTIVVWMSSGSTQHRILKQLVNSSFNQKGDINIDLKLVSSSLLSAIIAGKQPDVAIGINSVDIMNFAFRNAGVSVSHFDDFEEITKRFRPSMMIGVTFENEVYALPDTQSYQVMFYRSDILEELNIKVPETWDEVISAMAALKKNNLEFGIPLGTNTYTTLLFQKGKSFYNEDLTKTAVTDYDSLRAFETCCSWFTEYKCPISYDGLQRFRTGEMPILISGFEMYNNLDILAPEIKGLWGMTMIPGTPCEDGTLDRSVAISGTYSAILKDDNIEASWEFLKWWTSAETQLRYAQRLEMALGQSGRYNTSNLEAFAQLGYPESVLKVIEEQGDQSVDVPPVPGSYYLSRYLTNAMNTVLYQGDDPADALIGFAKTINEEIAYKREEFGLTK